MMKQLQSPETVPSFSKEQPVQYFEPRGALPADTTSLERGVDAATALYRTDPLIQQLAGSVRLNMNNYYIVNTEGTVVRMAQANHGVVIAAETQAPDGMRLQRGYG